ncbi:MAG: hypothetical protein V1816_05670 [Pseudomonadota bacterium]
MAKSSSTKVTIKGQILPNEWDEEDNVTSLMITDDDEREFLIEMTGKGQELLDFIDEYVEIVGTVKKWEGDYYLGVRSYEVIEEYDEEEDEEGWKNDDDDWIGDDEDWGDDEEYDEDWEDDEDDEEEHDHEWDEDKER